MKKKVLVIFLFISGIISAQHNFQEYERELSRYNDYFVNADGANHRKYAHEKFKPLFKEALNNVGSYYYPFDSLKWISKLVAPDSSFRVFTWQLDISINKKEYYGIVQKKDGSLFELKDNKSKFSDPEYEVFTSDDWYGQLYYDLHQYSKANKNEYLLFGYKQLNKYDKIKVAEPIYFEENAVYFGKDIFQDTLRQGGLKNRITLQTIVTAASKLNYDKNLGIIIYDHTIIIPLERPSSAGLPLVPDGSYHGYKWDGDKWTFIDKVFSQKYNEKAIPGRKSDGKKRDLLGKEEIKR